MHTHHKSVITARVTAANKAAAAINEHAPAVWAWLKEHAGQPLHLAGGGMTAKCRADRPTLTPGMWIDTTLGSSIRITYRASVAVRPDGSGHESSEQSLIVGEVNVDKKIVPAADGPPQLKADHDAAQVIAAIEQAERIMEDAKRKAQTLLDESGASGRWCHIRLDVNY